MPISEIWKNTTSRSVHTFAKHNWFHSDTRVDSMWVQALFRNLREMGLLQYCSVYEYQSVSQKALLRQLLP